MATVARPASATAVSLVKYYGRDASLPASDPLVVRALQQLRCCVEDVSKMTSGGEGRTRLKDSLLRLAAHLSDPAAPRRQYRLDILNEALLPYLLSMKGNYTLDPLRFQQVEHLVEALSEGEGADGDAHPALTCQLVDRLAAEINSKQYWTKSSLATNLENAVRKQWRPIIADNRQALQAAGVRLAALGLVEVVGRPVVMLYPVWLLLQQALLVVKGMETGEVSPRTVLAALKAVLLLALSSQLLALLALYQGMGYACLLMGGLALAASTSDAHVKALAPIIAPHLAHLDAFLERVGGAEAAAMRAMGLDDRRGGRPLSPHPQVSQLPPDTPEPERDEGSEDEQPHTQPQGEGEGEGLRRRGNRGATSPTWTSSTG